MGGKSGIEGEITYLGRYSNSQNGNIYGSDGISPCLCSGGSGHDATIPKIVEYELEDAPPDRKENCKNQENRK